MPAPKKKQYRVLVKSFINDRLYEKGDVISYAPPEPSGDQAPSTLGSNLEEIKATSKKSS